MARILLLCSLVIAVGIDEGKSAFAQQMTLRTPMFGFNEGFYEHFNVGWGYRHQSPRGSFFFDFNSPAFPPFGGYDPNADARFGLARRWGNGDLHFQFAAGQGSTRTMTMTAPSLTVMNGVPGSIQDTTIRPFVTGLIPTVGDFPMFPFYPSFTSSPTVAISPLAGKLEQIQSQRARGIVPRRPPGDAAPDEQLVEDESAAVPANRAVSSAESGDISIDEIQRNRAAGKSQRQAEIDQLVSEAVAARDSGNLAIARVRFRQAAAKAEGSLRKELLEAASKLR